MRRPMLFLLVLIFASPAMGNSCALIDPTIFCDNGLSGQRVGNSTLWNDDTSSNRVGSSSFYSDGTSSN